MVIRINIYCGHSSQCTRLHLAPAGVGKHLSTGNTGRAAWGLQAWLQDGHAEPPQRSAALAPGNSARSEQDSELQEEATNTRRLHWTHASFSKQGENPVLNAGGRVSAVRPGVASG